MRTSIGHMPALAAACAAFLLSLAGCAAVPRASEADLAALERARFAAMTRQDTEALRPMLADDLVYCHSNARCESRGQFLETIATGAIRYRAIEPRELHVRRFGELVLVNGRADIDGLAEGRPIAMQIVFLDAYVRREGRWQLLAWQSTRVP